jgi:cytochrome c oxidase subunit 2
MFFTFFNMDAASGWQVGFQDAASPVMEGIVNLHHDLLFYILFIFGFVLIVLLRCVYYFDYNSSVDIESDSNLVVHGTTIEIVWTVIPSLVLIMIALPSFALLFSIDEVIDPTITLKVVGHQWYWSYEYSDYTTDDSSINFDSYMIPSEDLLAGEFRLLEVDNRIVLPVRTHIRVLVTAADVLHSWAIPSLGIKMDACPGRLNQTSLYINREGVFYGQCSELCGTNHGFMPIVVEGVSLEKYVAWLLDKLEE